jgi:hypothetical protein
MTSVLILPDINKSQYVEKNMIKNFKREIPQNSSSGNTHNYRYYSFSYQICFNLWRILKIMLARITEFY